MSALAATVSALLALVPSLAGDAPHTSSIRQDTPTYVSGAVTSNERGRLVPARINGYPAWRCTRGKGSRNVRCSVERIGPRRSVLVTYQAAGGKSTTWVAARATRVTQ